MGSSAYAQPTEVAYYYPVAVGGSIAERMDKLAREFERSHSDIKVTPIYSGTYKESIFKALTAHKSGNPPPAAVLFSTDMHTLIDADAIVPFDDLAATPEDRAWLRSFYPAFMANSRAGGKVWGIPFQRSVILLYWNKRLFRQAGLDPEKPPRDWQALVEDARMLTLRDYAGQVSQWGIQIPATGFPYWLFQGLATCNDAELMNAGGNTVYFNQPRAVEALQYWLDLSEKYQVHPRGLVEWGKVPQDFIEEKVAMILTSSGNLSHIREKAGFDFGVTMIPANKRRGSPTGGGNFYLFKRSTPQQRAAAFQFIKWMTLPERAAEWSIGTGYVVVRPDAWKTPSMRRYEAEFPLASVAREQLSYAVPELSTHENQRVTNALNEAIAAALTGQLHPEQALDEAQAKAERILRPYRR